MEHLAKWVARVIKVENRQTIQGRLVEVSYLSSLALVNVTLTIFVCSYKNKYFLVNVVKRHTVESQNYDSPIDDL